MTRRILGLTAATSIAAVLTASAAMAASGTVAFLMPDQGSTRYEEHDFPGFKAKMTELCPDCTLIYQNATADASLQQQQFNSVLSQGAKVVVLDPVRPILRSGGSALSPSASPGTRKHEMPRRSSPVRAMTL